MSYVKKLKCVLCGSEYSPDEVTYTCPKCGDEGILEVIYDYEEISKVFSTDKLKDRPFNIWRYMELLPVENKGTFPPLKVGGTPLYDVERLRNYLKLKNLFIKDDGKNPTASLKDRASAIAVKKAMEIKADAITTASTGNAASSLAGVSASVGLPSFIFVPETAPKAKIAQLLVFGSTVFSVKGTYDDAFDLCIKASEEFGWYNRNTAYNPYTLEGKKTVSFEIWEQLGRAPDKVFVSVGDGVIYGGVYKGFYDLFSLGLIDKIPQVIGVQAEGSAPIVKAFEEGKDRVTPLKNPKTIADSISVGIPRNGTMALKYARKWNGRFISVSDDEILSAIPLLGKLTGIFGEPAGVTGLSGLIKMINEGEIDKDETIVVIVTGNGLKDVESAMKSVGEPIHVENSFLDVKRKVKEL